MWGSQIAKLQAKCHLRLFPINLLPHQESVGIVDSQRTFAFFATERYFVANLACSENKENVWKKRKYFLLIYVDERIFEQITISKKCLVALKASERRLGYSMKSCSELLIDCQQSIIYKTKQILKASEWRISFSMKSSSKSLDQLSDQYTWAISNLQDKNKFYHFFA